MTGFVACEGKHLGLMKAELRRPAKRILRTRNLKAP